MASSSAAQSSLPAGVLLGNRSVSLAELMKVAVQGAPVLLDSAALEAVLKEQSKAADKRAPTLVVPDLASGTRHPLDSRLVRAFLVVQLTRWLKAKSGVRASLIEFLAALVNANILPVLYETNLDWEYQAWVTSVLAGDKPREWQRYDVTTGAPLTATPSDLATLLSGSTISPPEPLLTALEQHTLLHSTALATGVASLAVQAADVLAVAADATAGLSLEALQALRPPFEATHNELARNHRGLRLAAASIRYMLENSRSAEGGKKGKGEPRDPLSLRAVPQIHAPGREAVAEGVRLMRVELNAGPAQAVSLSAGSGGSFHPASVQEAAVFTGYALDVWGSAAEGRLRHLLQHAEGGQGDDDDQAAVPLPGAVVGLREEVDRASGQLAALAPVPTRDVAKQAAGALGADVDRSTQAVKAAVLAFVRMLRCRELLALEATAAQQVLGRRQRALEAAWEVKRAKKAAKEAELLAQGKKGGKKGAGGGGGGGGDDKLPTLPLGLGALHVRAYLASSGVTTLAAGAASTPLLQRIAPMLRALDPYSSQLAEALQPLVESANQLRKPKLPKGTRDYFPAQMAVREWVFDQITGVFKRHGGVTIDTPVFELKETLTGKYGEDSKLIYDLADQGGENLALRYDLTVPFARFMAMNQSVVGQSIKRYHIAKVYRRDQPQMNRGRYREFYQCDFDIAGSHGPMIADAEILAIMVEVLRALDLGDFEVKLNHRRLLDAMLAVCGVPTVKFRPICSAIDKLDKEPWEAVRAEMVEEKGLLGDVADRIRPFVALRGHPEELRQKLVDEKWFGDNADGAAALEEMSLLIRYLRAFNVLDKISFDLSLARGLDYYTGIIYEAVLVGGTAGGVNVGSIGGGGRYDTLVGMFSGSAKGSVPCVGVSIGIERVFAIIEGRRQMRTSPTQVLVGSVGGLLEERMALTAELWAAGLRAEFIPQAKVAAQRQVETALNQKIPLMLVIGEDELKAGTVKVKELESSTQVEVARADLVPHLKAALARLGGSAD